MFERIISDPEIVERYQPKVWARPTLADGDSTKKVDYLVDSPWVVTLDNFLSADEAQILIDHGGKLGYERSADVGEMLEDGSFEDDVNEGRTSENSWCEEECKDDPVTIGIMERIEFVTGIHANHSESLQLLRYEPGQFCKEIYIFFILWVRSKSSPIHFIHSEQMAFTMILLLTKLIDWKALE